MKVLIVVVLIVLAFVAGAMLTSCDTRIDVNDIGSKESTADTMIKNEYCKVVRAFKNRGGGSEE